MDKITTRAKLALVIDDMYRAQEADEPSVSKATIKIWSTQLIDIWKELRDR